MIEGVNPAWMDFSGSMPQAKTEHVTKKMLDIPYGPHKLQTLDIYYPENGEGPFPVIVNVHGGGFTHCDKRDFHLYPTLFALERGFAVAAVNYRLSPKVRYPAHLADVMRALNFLGEHAEEYRLDAQNAFLWGTSAGGNLVLHAGCVEGMNGLIKHTLRIGAVAALCPAADLEKLSKAPNLRIAFALFLLRSAIFGPFPSKAALENSKPESFFSGGIAPVYLQHGENDPVIPLQQMRALAGKLSVLLPGEDFVFDVIAGARHAGDGPDYFMPEHILPILAFFERHIKA
ncbi:MAG TPA: alpha/beta hydrolase [Clostridia bacterium]|nr:alpha/beta hydrolase [Clostridia bacterium]